MAPQRNDPGHGDKPSQARPTYSTPLSELAQPYIPALYADAQRLVLSAGYLSGSGLADPTFEHLRSARYADLVAQWLSGPDGAAAILQTFSETDDSEPLLALAHALCQRGFEEQLLAVSLLELTFQREATAGRPDYVARALGILLRHPFVGDSQYEPVIQRCFAAPFLSGLPVFRRLIDHVLEERSASPEQLRFIEDLIQAAADKDPEARMILLRLATLPDIDEAQRDSYIKTLASKPLPALSALSGLLYLMDRDPSLKQAFLPYLSPLHGFGYEYWDAVVPYTLERGLLLAAQHAPIHQIRQFHAKDIPPSCFAYAIDLSDLISDRLEPIDRAFRYVNELKEGHPEAGQSISQELKRAFSRCALPALHSRLALQMKLAQLAQDPEANTTDEKLEFVGALLSLLNETASRQRTFSHFISTGRLGARSRSDGDADPNVVAALLEQIPSADRQQVQLLLELPPLFTLYSGHDLSPEAAAATVWETEGEHPLLEDIERLGIDPQDLHRIARSWGYFELEQYIRALTIGDSTAALAFFGEILKYIDPEERERWRAWRYAEHDPSTQSAFASFSTDTRQILQNDLWVELADLSGDSRFGFLVTDHPRLLFHSGTLPVGSLTCTSYNGGAYYAQNLLSYLGDPHIRVGFEIDLVQYEANCYMRKHGRPPPTSLLKRFAKGESCAEGSILDNIECLLPAIRSRTVLKSVRDVDGKPGLLLQPTFYRGQTTKQFPDNGVLGSLCAQLYGGGVRLFVHPIDAGGTEMVTVPPSRSPVGQIENYDGAAWTSSYRGTYQVLAQEVNVDFADGR